MSYHTVRDSDELVMALGSLVEAIENTKVARLQLQKVYERRLKLNHEYDNKQVLIKYAGDLYELSIDQTNLIQFKKVDVVVIE